MSRYSEARGGRAHRYSGLRSFNRFKRPNAPEDYPSSAGHLVKDLSVHDVPLASLEVHQPKITNCRCVSSWNWVGRQSPVMLVPGSPPMWTPLRDVVTLKEDDGTYYRDENSARSPHHPMEPAIRVFFESSEASDHSFIDLVACGNTLSNLLRFVRSVKKPCRFWTEIVGHTMFFVRRERSPQEVIKDVRGYGHSFPEAYTTWQQDVKGSESHQRLLRYEFAGKEMLVRFEGDGFLPELAVNASKAPTSSPTSDEDATEGVSLEQAFAGMNAQVDPHSGSQSDPAPVKMRDGGQVVPQSAVFDLKTRSFRKKDVDILGEELHRLWINQVPNFILAFHESGKFDDIRVQNVRKEIDEWETANQESLSRLAGLIDVIRNCTENAKDKKLEVRTTSDGKLEMRELTDAAWSALPADLAQRWTQSPSTPDRNGEGGGELKAPLTWSDDEDEKDYTACSSDGCGFCGHCSY